MKYCPNYIGVACVNGSCPISLQDEYQERGCDIIRECEDCSFFNGCDDCISFQCLNITLEQCKKQNNIKEDD